MKYFLIIISILLSGHHAIAEDGCERGYLKLDTAQLKSSTAKNKKAFNEFNKYIKANYAISLENSIEEYLERKRKISDNYGFGKERRTFDNGDTFYRMHEVIDYYVRCKKSEHPKIKDGLGEFIKALEADQVVQKRTLEVANKWVIGSSGKGGPFLLLLHQEKAFDTYMREFRNALNPKSTIILPQYDGEIDWSQ